MEPEIKVLKPKKLIGMYREMSLSSDSTHELWRNFMQKRHLFNNLADDKFYNVKVFEQDFDLNEFNTTTIFQKWAAVEVSEFNNELVDFEHFTLKGGTYAVFIHHGPASTFHHTLQHIFDVWLPASEYILDDRAHFERFTKDYNPTDPNAKEEVWIPIK